VLVVLLFGLVFCLVVGVVVSIVCVVCLWVFKCLCIGVCWLVEMFMELGWGRGLIAVGGVCVRGFCSGFLGCVVFVVMSLMEVVFGVCWLVVVGWVFGGCVCVVCCGVCY